jgi:hypothetical protein
MTNRCPVADPNDFCNAKQRFLSVNKLSLDAVDDELVPAEVFKPRRKNFQRYTTDGDFYGFRIYVYDNGYNKYWQGESNMFKVKVDTSYLKKAGIDYLGNQYNNKFVTTEGYNRMYPNLSLAGAVPIVVAVFVTSGSPVTPLTGPLVGLAGLLGIGSYVTFMLDVVYRHPHAIKRFSKPVKVETPAFANLESLFEYIRHFEVNANAANLPPHTGVWDI